MTMLSTLMLSTVACSTSDEDLEETPVDTIAKDSTANDSILAENLKPGTDERPAWQKTSDLHQRLGSEMSAQVTVQEELLPYVSTGDLMCVTVNDEVRAVSEARYDNGEWVFTLVIAGTGDDKFLSVSYYCSQLKKIYTLERWYPFSESFVPTLANGRPYTINFF